jgi:hypothetical protein
VKCAAHALGLFWCELSSQSAARYSAAWKIKREKGRLVRELKLIEIDGGLGVALPADVLAKLGARAGGVLHLREDDEGVRLFVATPELATQQTIAREIIARRHAALAELAS